MHSNSLQLVLEPRNQLTQIFIKLGAQTTMMIAKSRLIRKGLAKA